MKNTLLHVYRNTPLGRETLLQSAYYCHAIGCELGVYIPRHAQFLMYFEHATATVVLDSTYLRDPETAAERVVEIAGEFDIVPKLVEPSGFTADTLPNVSGAFAAMACPRSMSELSSKIRFGHLGPRVRAIVRAASFPVLLPTPVFKPWNRVVACYGGSENSVRAALLARRISEAAEVPLALFTHAGGEPRESFEKPLAAAGLLGAIGSGRIEWVFSEIPSLAEGLYGISRDSLVVAGAYGHGAVREAFFGSKLEAIQTEVPNNLLVVGPNVPGV